MAAAPTSQAFGLVASNSSRYASRSLLARFAQRLHRGLQLAVEGLRGRDLFRCQLEVTGEEPRVAEDLDGAARLAGSLRVGQRQGQQGDEGG